MKKKIKNGFTLIELLAIIVLLGLIALIITPKINETLRSQRKKVFEESVQGILKTVKQDVVNNVGIGNNGTSYRAYTYDGSNLILVVGGEQSTEEKIATTGNIKNGGGTVIVTANNEIILAIYNDRYCATKVGDSNNIEVSDYDGITCGTEEIEIPDSE